MVASLKIEVFKEKLYASAVFLNVGVSNCQGLLLVKAERVFSSSCHRLSQQQSRSRLRSLGEQGGVVFGKILGVNFAKR